MRRSRRPARGIWTLVQATILLGVAVAAIGAGLWGGDADRAPEPPHRLGPAGTATLTDSLTHDLDNCRIILNNGGDVRDC